MWHGARNCRLGVVCSHKVPSSEDHLYLECTHEVDSEEMVRHELTE